ncbi:MAG: B12-binding domain-containing protein, partial [Clostridia bacterium]|nr:B12-binding domain-containing protein [Clostridia bacterium]
MAIVEEIRSWMLQGRAKQVKQLVAQALEVGVPAQEILNDGLRSAMNEIGEKFKNNEVFVPEVLIAARAMNAGM